VLAFCPAAARLSGAGRTRRMAARFSARGFPMTRLRALFSCLLLVASGPLLADAASHAAEAKRFIEMSRADRLAVPAHMQVRQMFAQRFAQAGGSEAKKAVLERYQAQADAAIERVVGKGKLESELVSLYTDAFTEAELKELLAFYQTPVGRKVLEQMPQLMAHAAQLTQERLQQAVPEVDKLLGEMTAELQPAKQ
jgi:uncharacterized protein